MSAAPALTLDADHANLARRAKDGDEAAFEEILRRYQRPIYDYCRRLVNDPAAAEDLAHETFVKFFFALPQYDAAKPLSPYIFRIAHNHCLDWLRKKRVTLIPLSWEDEEGEEVTWDVPDGRPAPDEDLAAAELARALDAALETMPPLYRAALILRFREDLSYEEIASTLGLPVGTVKAQISRGREKLQRKLREHV